MRRAIFALFVILLVIALIQPSVFAQASKPKATGTTPKPASQPAMPDLVIDQKSIVFSEVSPMEGDSVTISATVSNKGKADIPDDVEVRFIEGDPKEYGLQIASNAFLLGLKAGASGKVSVKWRADVGEIKVYAIADPDNLIKESNEDNNIVIKTIKGRTWTGPKVTQEQIKQSIDKAVAWLRTQQGEFYVTCPNGHDNFLFSAMAYGKCVICMASLEGLEPVRLPDETMPGGWMPEIGPGLTALVISAFLFAGVDESDPAIVKGMDHLFNKSPAPWKEWSDSYDYAVLILALTATGNKEKYMEVVKFSTQKIFEFQTEDGGWGYGTALADAAHFQYVIFGLYAAQQWGVEIPSKVWTKAASWLTRLQRPDGGWNYNGEGIGPFAVDSYGSMTATGVMGLKAAGIPPSNESVKRGIEWLTKHYSVTRNPGSYYWHYYFMNAVQRAMDMPPKQEKLGEHDWYFEMASFFLDKQQPDGGWIADTPIYASGAVQVQTVIEWGADRGDIMTTTFALMFLLRAMPKSATVDLGFGNPIMMFSKADPVEGEQIDIKTSISNLTDITAENIEVAFYDGDPQSAGIPIGTPQTIVSLAGNETKEVSISWEAKQAGEHKIYVVIDPSNLIEEVSKYNNVSYDSLNVGGKSTPAIPGIINVGNGLFKLGKVDLDLNKKIVTIYGKINMQAGLIELLACTKIGKVHESVLVLDVEPIHMQTALILLGLEFVGGLRYQGDPLTPKGDRVQIWVEWNSGDKVIRHRAEDLVYNRVKQASMEHTSWVFSGSRARNGVFMAQSTGTLIVTYHDPDAILDNPLPDGGDDTVYIVNSQVVPPKGTEIKMTLMPA
jgi:hypothetical protein